MTPAGRRLGLALISLAGLAALLVIYFIYNSLFTFHIVRTDPPLRNFTSSASFLDVYFNRPLSTSDVTISSDPSVVSTYKITGKKLEVDFGSILNYGQSYAINISLHDNTGKRLTKKLVFKPKYVPLNELSNTQIQTQLQNQVSANNQRTVRNMAFNNINSLMNFGITASQIAALKQAIFKFNPNSRVAGFSSIKPTPHDPASSTDSINFTLTIDSATYHATAYYSDLSSLRLKMYSSSGKLVFYSH